MKNKLIWPAFLLVGIFIIVILFTITKLQSNMIITNEYALDLGKKIAYMRQREMENKRIPSYNQLTTCQDKEAIGCECGPSNQGVYVRNKNNNVCDNICKQEKFYCIFAYK